MKVNGEGKKESKLWLIGEAGGVQEEKFGRPFCGGSGAVLDGILQDIPIDRRECYVDNVIQERPPRNDFGVYYKDKGRRQPKDILLDARRRLTDDIKLYRPNVVAALGGEALIALTNKRYIMKWRGSILSCDGVKVIPTIRPTSIMRQYELRPIAVLDLKRVKQESLTPDFPEPYDDKFITNPTFSQVMEYLDLLHHQEYVAFDIETAHGQIVCIGFSWSKTEAICIPICFSTSSWWTKEEENHIISRIRKLFQNPKVKFIAQNAQYDMIWLADKWGVDVENLWMDTMIAFHCTYPELRKGLDFLCSIYTNRPYYKDPGKTPDELWLYNCLDTVVTWEVSHEIERDMQEFGTEAFYRGHSHKLIKPLIAMQRYGVKIDVKRREELDVKLESDLEEMQKRLNSAVGHELNTNSPKQMMEFLYGELKLPPQRDRRTKNLTADEDAIETLAKKFPNPVFSLVLDIRKVRKLLSTYIRAPLDPDNRMRCNYVITGTETGRLSSRENVYGRGTNLQNIPRGKLVRGIFIADSGTVFINADLSQAEARVVAYLAKETRLQDVFKYGNDVHTKNASMVFGKKVSDITDEERNLAKALVHATHYGVGPRTFARHIGVEESRARALLNQYHALYPRIKLWHMDTEFNLRKTRVMTTPLGRKRMFFGRWGPDLVRDALAYVPQSTVGDMLNQGIIRAFPALPQDWHMILQNHDSVLFQVPKDADHTHIVKFITHYFEIPIKIHDVEFIIPVKISVGKDWGNLKELEVQNESKSS